MALYHSENIGGGTSTLTLSELTSDNAKLAISYKITNGMVSAQIVLSDDTVSAQSRTINKRLRYQLPVSLHPTITVLGTMFDENTTMRNSVPLYIYSSNGELRIECTSGSKLIIGANYQALAYVNYVL